MKQVKSKIELYDLRNHLEIVVWGFGINPQISKQISDCGFRENLLIRSLVSGRNINSILDPLINNITIKTKHT